MAMKIETARLAVYFAAWQVDHNMPYAFASAIAKAYGSDVAMQGHEEFGPHMGGCGDGTDSALAHRREHPVVITGQELKPAVVHDGLGMVEVPQGIPGERVGLAIMRERTERLPGQLVIESEPDEGTRIVLMFTAPPS